MLIESLRDYQINAINQLRDGVRHGHRCQILVAPTGAGKTVSASYLLNEARAKQSVAWFICDRVSLVDQTSTTLDRYGVPHGVIQADHWRWRPYEYVQVISAQTLARRKIDNPPKLIVIDECFAAGSMVSTVNGVVPIELVRHGDLVLNATGVGRVLATSARPLGKRKLVKVTFDDGSEIHCTEEHRFFTTELWVQAGELAGKSVLDEKSMLSLWDRNQTINLSFEERIGSISIAESMGGKANMLSILCEEIEKSHAQRVNQEVRKPNIKTDWSQAKDPRGEWQGFVEAASDAAREAWRRLESRVCGDNKTSEFGIPTPLQDRSSEPREDDCNRGRRRESHHTGKERTGQEKGSVSCIPRVVSVEIIESESDRPVFNLHIEGHPSYFINGKLVHNCHTIFKSVADAINRFNDAHVVGLTATPFTKGLGKIFTNVVNSTTTDKLINDGWLVPVKMYAAKQQMDMSQADIKFDGEWAEKDMENQGIAIVGDVVAEWIEKTNKEFNGPVKTIVFSATVAHGEELCREFAERGYNFQQISYKDGNNERRREIIEEFRKPDSEIIGLISCEALAKGFDVTDIKIGICARPYRKSLSSHIQQMGRVMRPHPGKEYAVWLDHAGNLTRFWEDQVDIFAHGVQELEDGKLDAKVRKEPTEKEKAEIKCTACGYMFRGRVCPACGAERRAASNVLNTAGQMVEFGGTKSSDWMSDKRLVWWEIVQISKDRKRGDIAAAERFAKAQYKNLTGEWPRWKFHEAIFVEPRMVTQNKIKQQVIKYAKSKFGRRLA